MISFKLNKYEKKITLIGAIILLMMGTQAFAEPAVLSLGGVFSNGVLPGLVEPKRLSVLLESLLVLTFISFVPSLLMMTTAFLRMIIVLSFLRHALGTQQTPPNSILISLALLLTFFVMSPTLKQINSDALEPYQQKKISWNAAVEKGANVLAGFMIRQTRKKDLALSMNLAHMTTIKTPNELPFTVIATGFALSELKTAFEIGFLIFIPFLVIDLVVSSVLMALGMMMVPPSTISLPLKILLFVMMDGWNLLIQGLAQSIR